MVRRALVRVQPEHARRMVGGEVILVVRAGARDDVVEDVVAAPARDGGVERRVAGRRVGARVAVEAVQMAGEDVGVLLAIVLQATVTSEATISRLVRDASFAWTAA